MTNNLPITREVIRICKPLGAFRITRKFLKRIFKRLKKFAPFAQHKALRVFVVAMFASPFLALPFMLEFSILCVEVHCVVFGLAIDVFLIPLFVFNPTVKPTVEPTVKFADNSAEECDDGTVVIDTSEV